MGDYFVHRSAISGTSFLDVGAKVAFAPGWDSERSKCKATEVTLPELQSDETKAITATAIANAIDEIVLHLGLYEAVDDLPEEPIHWDNKQLPRKQRFRPPKRFRTNTSPNNPYVNN